MRRTAILAGTVGVYLIVLAMVGDERIPLIGFTGPVSAAAAAIAPLAIMAAVTASLASRDRHHELLASRRIWLHDVWLVGITAMVCCLGAWALRHVQPFAVEASRNLVGFTGVALVIRPLTGERAAVALTTAGVLLALAFSRAQHGLHPWAWPLADRGSPWAATTAALLFAAGIAATASTRNRRFG